MTVKPAMSNELRSMVREVLRDVMANHAAPATAAIEAVRISNDHELAAFVARAIEPATAEKIKSGKLRFTLAGVATQAAAAPAGMMSGVITEQKIGKLDVGAALVLGPGAVLTPLARDKARKLGLKIERRR